MQLFKGHKEPVQRLTYSPDGKTLLSTTTQLEGRLWDLALGKRRWSLDSSFLFWAVFTPDGKHLLTGESGNTIRMWDVETGAEVPAPVEGGGDQMFHTCLFSPDGSRCLAIDAGARDEKNVVVWACPSWKPDKAWKVPVEWHWQGPDLRFSPDGQTLAVMAHDGVRLHKVPTGAVAHLHPFEVKQSMGCLAFHPKGTLLAIGSGTRMAILDLASRKEIAEMKQPKKYFLQAAFTPDGRYLGTVSNEETVKLWDTSSWQLVHEFSWQVGGLRCIAFAPDGMTAAAGGAGKKIIVWDMDF